MCSDLTASAPLCRITTMAWLSHAALLVLKEFLENPAHEITGALVIRNAGLLSGTVYPILMRFERSGLVASRWEEAEPRELGRPRRRLYRLTGEGFRVAQESLGTLSIVQLQTDPSRA
jgi:PadR family transcriptional regulator, regulatory protein PadR